MYEYKLVTYQVQYERGELTSGYHAIIHEHAAQGWRLVQIFAPQLPAVPSFYELIFERSRQG